MEKFDSIILGYQDLFFKTGKIEFFMLYRSLQKLNKRTALIDLDKKEVNNEETISL